MSDGVLPALLVVAVVREVADDEFVDSVQSQSFVGAAADSHHDHSVVAVWRLLGTSSSRVIGRRCDASGRSTI